MAIGRTLYGVLSNKVANNWLGRQNAAPLKFDPKLSDTAFSAVFSNFDKCRQEVADDVIFCAVEGDVGMDVSVKVLDSTLNSGRIIRLIADRTRFAHFCAVVNCILEPTGS